MHSYKSIAPVEPYAHFPRVGQRPDGAQGSTRTSCHRWRLFSAVPCSANCRISTAVLDLSGEARYGSGRQIQP